MTQTVTTALDAGKPDKANLFEVTARAAGWTHGGDFGGFIFHAPTWGTWKAAASWEGEDELDGPNDYPRTYSTWAECYEAEGLDQEPALDETDPAGPS